MRPSAPTRGWIAGPGPALEGLSPRRPFSSFGGVLLGQRSDLTGLGRGELWPSQPQSGPGPCRARSARGRHAAGSASRLPSSPSGPGLGPNLPVTSPHQRPWSSGTSPGGLDACSHGTHVADGGALYHCRKRGSEAPLGPTCQGAEAGSQGTTLSPQRGEDQQVTAASQPAAAPVRAELCSRRRGPELRPHAHGAALTPRGAVEEVRAR